MVVDVFPERAWWCDGPSRACPEQTLRACYLCRDGKLFDYQGERTAAAIRDWGLSLLPNHVKKVGSQVRYGAVAA